MAGLLDNLGDHAGTVATWTVSVVGGILAGLHLFFRGKKEIRSDRAAERIDDGYDKFLEHHAKLIDRQDHEIARQAAEVSDRDKIIAKLTEDLNAERAGRHDTQRELFKVEARLVEALDRIAYLSGRRISGDG